MTELELYKFITQNDIECHEDNNDVIAFINIQYLDKFIKLIGSSILDDEGVQVILKDGYICIHMMEICEHHDVELSNVFNNNNVEK